MPPGPYDSFNLAFHVGDDVEHVCANRRALGETLGFDATMLSAAQQTHETRAQIIAAESRGQGALDWESAHQQTDALITADHQTPLLILVADCAPLLLVDASAHILAVVHAGWRGAVARIVSQTIEEMKTLGAEPERIQIGIGPHLCTSCFEVGEEVALAAASVAPDAVVQGAAKPYVDLSAVLKSDALRGGAREPNIEAMNLCPRCENETFFSHRGQNGSAGRFGLVAWWE